MRTGLHLVSHRVDPSADIARLVADVTADALLAESLGFDVVMLGHHYLSGAPLLQPIPLAAHLAAHTRTVRIGFGVLLLPLLAPVAVAEELATLDQLSGGRLVVGIGAGYRPVEFDAMGLRFADRYRRIETGVAVLRRLWSGEPVVVSRADGGEEAVRSAIRPRQPGGPPLWLGAKTSRGIRRAVDLGVSWVALTGRGERHLTECAASWRGFPRPTGEAMPGERPIIADTYVAHDGSRALERARRYARRPRGSAEPDPDPVLADRWLVGSPSQILERVTRWRDELGFTQVVFRLDWPGAERAEVIEGIELLGKQVLSALSGAPPAQEDVRPYRDSNAGPTA